ncbi:DUF6602 domain-containing protein [Denitromonas halophila]|uniref:DUF6602 domain-containing protein n=1 Tax=Denitromonas halophila TaxID=1629404 RepID=A0A557R2R6_9RHOO|nr:DUF6602 domain-containing protein [Denitromonas halophila]TVO59457.1 hypothetical protein FHP91_01725 [Denitromonas halophila]
MNKAKKASAIDGKHFLREAFAAEQEVLRLKLELSSKSITHNGVMGEVNEHHFIEVLRKYLPNRYAVAQGIVVDSNGATSDQIDIIIFDPQYTPTLLDQQSHRFVPAEAVYGVLEAKPTISKQYLEYAADKAASVRRLERTSVPIRHAGGEFPPKTLFPILAGIVAPCVDWADGCKSSSFAEVIGSLTDERSLDCGIALSDRAFQVSNGSIALSDCHGSLAVFLFGLLDRLQNLGTVPAVDWNRYGSVFSGDL